MNEHIKKFVTYHTYIPPDKKNDFAETIIPTGREHILNHVFREHTREYTEMIQMFFSSARACYPNCVCEVLTDTETDFEHLPPYVSIRRFPSDPTKLMLNRLHAQIEALRSEPDGTIIYMLDSDILVNRPMTVADHDHEYAITLTTRDNSEAPINGGVFIISGARRQEAIVFLERVSHIHTTKYADFPAWFGDQFSLRDAVLEKTSDGTIPEQGDLSGGIRLFPASLYNYTPPKGSLYRELVRKRQEYLLHFKGNAKKGMKLYWEAFIGPQNNPLNIRAWLARIHLTLRSLREML